MVSGRYAVFVSVYVLVMVVVGMLYLSPSIPDYRVVVFGLVPINTSEMVVE